MPLSLTSEEMDILVSLSGPIAPSSRPLFLQEVADALAAAGERGVGTVHRIARPIQRKFWEPPALSPEMNMPRHPGPKALKGLFLARDEQPGGDRDRALGAENFHQHQFTVGRRHPRAKAVKPG